MLNLRNSSFTCLAIGSLFLAACDNATAPAMTAKPISTSTAPASESFQMTAQLSGEAETPPNKSKATGMLEASLDKPSSVLTWTITYSDLTGPATAAHFHGPAALGVNAPPVLPLSGVLNSPIKGTATLTPAQASDLTSGNWYLNVHTAANPEGEIRGQVTIKK